MRLFLLVAVAIFSIILASNVFVFTQEEKESAPAAVVKAPEVKVEAATLKVKAPEKKAPSKPLACIIDLDGTIADESKRREEAAGADGKLSGKEYEAYFDPSKVPGDTPLPTALDTLKWLNDQGIIIFYVSSRPATMLDASKEWIKNNGFVQGKDVYHKKDKYEKSLKYKTRVIEEIKADGYDVLFGVGDRDKDIQSYEAADIIGIKVEPNTDEDWKGVRAQIEEILKKQAAQ